MQQYVSRHEGSSNPLTASQVFPASGGVVHNTTLEFDIETFFATGAPAQPRICTLALADFGRSRQGGMKRLVTSVGSVAASGGVAAAFLFRCELDASISPLTVTYAQLAACSALEITPIPLESAFGCAHWEYAHPMDLNVRGNNQNVFYGVCIHFSLIPTGLIGYVSGREVIREIPVLQPNK